jgi:hypothetical protein
LPRQQWFSKWPHMHIHIFFVTFTWDLTLVLILMILNVPNYIILALGLWVKIGQDKKKGGLGISKGKAAPNIFPLWEGSVWECKEIANLPNTFSLLRIWNFRCLVILEPNLKYQTLSKFTYFYIVGKILKSIYLKWVAFPM